MTLRLKLPLTLATMFAPWSAFAQGVASAASAPSGVTTSGGHPIVEWFVIIGVSAVVSAVVATVVAKKVVEDQKSNS